MSNHLRAPGCGTITEGTLANSSPSNGFAAASDFCRLTSGCFVFDCDLDCDRFRDTLVAGITSN